MTIGQIKLYLAAAQRHQARTNLNTMGTIRAAHHADAKEYKKLFQSIQREIDQ